MHAFRVHRKNGWTNTIYGIYGSIHGKFQICLSFHKMTSKILNTLCSMTVYFITFVFCNGCHTTMPYTGIRISIKIQFVSIQSGDSFKDSSGILDLESFFQQVASVAKV